MNAEQLLIRSVRLLWLFRMRESWVIRCDTPDCDWGHHVSDTSEHELKLCYSEFRKHCIRRHGLQEWESAQAYLDVEHWLLTLIKE